MKAWPAVTELRLMGLAFVLAGLLAITLSPTHSRREHGSFVVVAAGAFSLAAVAHLVVVLRRMRRAQVVPQPVVVETRRRTLWQRVVPSTAPFGAVIVVSAALGVGTSAVIGAGCVLIGAVMIVESAVAARLERRRGTRLLRVDQRFVLNH